MGLCGGRRGFITTVRPLVHGEPPAAAAPVASASQATVTLHRARNDFQILSSLLTLQADSGGDSDARSALLAGKDRLNAVAIVYRLIQGEEDTVDFARYASELGRMLLETRRIAADRIKIEIASETARLPQKTAITLGLILEELLSAATRAASACAWSKVVTGCASGSSIQWPANPCGL